MNYSKRKYIDVLMVGILREYLKRATKK